MAFKKEIEELKQGRKALIHPKGNSMTPKIRSGQAVLLSPIDREIKRGDIVIAKVKGSIYIHLVSAVDKNRVQISNNHGHVNGWTVKSNVYGFAEAL